MRQRGNDLILGARPDGQPLWFSREQRRKHLYAVGATGTGKSKFLEWQIRQDILNWPRSRCGLIVFDKHGALFDSVMGWVAAKGLRHLPIVPIDLRQSDHIVSYNVLRRRSEVIQRSSSADFPAPSSMPGARATWTTRPASRNG